MQKRKNNLPSLELVVGFLAALLILGGLIRLDWSLPPISGLIATLNDQVGYIYGARSLVDKGWVDSCCIYPSTLLQETRKTVFYGPGHYWAMALPIWLFGANEISFMLANALSFLGCIVLVFSCAKTFYCTRSAFFAALIFSIFPFLLIYALSSMAELTVIFSAVFSFWLVVLIKGSRFTRFSPLIALIPIFFRETSIVIIFPMAGVLFSEELKQRRYANFGKFILFSCLFWCLVMIGPLGGRPSLLKANIFGGFSEIYLDALAFKNFDPEIHLWVRTIFYRFKENFIYGITNPIFSLENITLKIVLGLTGFTLISGFLRKDFFDLGVAFMGIILWSFVCGFYAPDGFRGLRVMLVLVPLLCISLSKWTFLTSSRHLAIITIVLFSCGVASYLWLTQDFSQLRKTDLQKEVFINSLEVNSDKVLIAPYWMGLPWIYRNYPSRWAFFPANLETLLLLDEKAPLGTLILSEIEVQKLGKKVIQDLNFCYVKSIAFQSENFSVFEKKGALTDEQ